jgi:hypothetical protein
MNTMISLIISSPLMKSLCLLFDLNIPDNTTYVTVQETSTVIYIHIVHMIEFT